jgi:transcriptional regulator with XRE-family HTH domain
MTYEVMEFSKMFATVDAMSAVPTPPVGAQLRRWRTHRQLSQLALSMQADISTRHLSYVETGRSLPSREMILRLARRLEVPLRERNNLLTAAGFAPMYAIRSLDDPALMRARQVVELVLRAHEPSPALAVDRHWNIVMQNNAVPILLEGVADTLLEPPVNALRLSLHPEGMAPRIVNFDAWRSHVLARLQRQFLASGDVALHSLKAELAAYPTLPGAKGGEQVMRDESGVAVPLLIDTRLGRLAFMSTTTVFGTPVEVTLSEMALETFFPADDATAAALQRAAGSRSHASP